LSEAEKCLILKKLQIISDSVLVQGSVNRRIKSAQTHRCNKPRLCLRLGSYEWPGIHGMKDGKNSGGFLSKLLALAIIAGIFYWMSS